MEKVIILKENEYSLVVNALYAYLSAGSKEKREDASFLAKAAYFQLTGTEYKNPE